ncbi:phage I-like protein [Ruminiclostridium sufflavum DSM 19573]|uniref:Phage I-like protein n=1 Tax=Ruminiclostridium sufflavum DSM 19573 TaxID=1121337 RepID=A0A318XM37_9FIRM|nr:phage protease [Ruminiclostridium sufflavum]PYG86729.1 phage I-like protein [Ruminiclostridium sufflavum DSM 19573]
MSKIFACSGGQSELKGAPEKVKLLPIGHVKSQKGDFDVDEESFRLMKEKFQERGLDIVIDYEHQTLKDVQAPAGGWIKDLSIEDGAIVAKVEWTQQGKKYLENKEYRYLSPVVLVRKSDGKAIVLHSAALTNTPAIDGMFPIINAIKIEDYEGGNSMDILKQLAALLGLGEDATEEQVIEALKTLAADAKKLKEQGDKKPEGGSSETEGKVVSNKVICEMLGLKAGAKTEDVAAAILALSSNKPEGSVSEKEFKELKDKIALRDAGDAVLMALKAGKLTPAQKDWATQYALKDPDGFKSFVEKAPQGIPMGELELETETKQNKEKRFDAETLLVCKQLGVNEDDIKKYGKDVK